MQQTFHMYKSQNGVYLLYSAIRDQQVVDLLIVLTTIVITS